MYRILLFLLLPLGSLYGQSQTSWKVYKLFSNENIPVGTKDIQAYLPGYSVFKIQSNQRKSSLHAIIDDHSKVNGLVFSSPDYQDKMTRLVIPTPNSAPEILKTYLNDRAHKLTERQKSELIDLITQFSMDSFSKLKDPLKDLMVKTQIGQDLRNMSSPNSIGFMS